MAVYTHFGSMAGVVDEVATEGFRRLIAHVDAVRLTDDPLADLRRTAQAYRDNALENRHLFGVMFGAISTGGFHGRGPGPGRRGGGVRPGRGRASPARWTPASCWRATRARWPPSSGAPCTAT